MAPVHRPVAFLSFSAGMLRFAPRRHRHPASQQDL
jgi:hypothetical protein